MLSFVVSPTTETVTEPMLWPIGMVSVPLVATKSLPAVAVPEAVAKSTVTGSIAVLDSLTVNVKAFVPLFPSFAETPEMESLHSKRRSCRWFLSPQPLPAFVLVDVVVVVVVVEVVVEVDVLVEVDVVVGVVVVVVVVVGVVVLVVVVVVEQ